jgi:hypothetical protein
MMNAPPPPTHPPTSNRRALPRYCLLPLLLLTTACYRLLPSATAYYRLPPACHPPATACYRILPHPTAYCRLLLAPSLPPPTPGTALYRPARTAMCATTVTATRTTTGNPRGATHPPRSAGVQTSTGRAGCPPRVAEACTARGRCFSRSPRGMTRRAGSRTMSG